MNANAFGCITNPITAVIGLLRALAGAHGSRQTKFLYFYAKLTLGAYTEFSFLYMKSIEK